MDRREFLVYSVVAAAMCPPGGAAGVSGAPKAPPVSPALPPAIPVGLDAYRQWDRWAYQRIGARAYMRSTYDRSGGNADASHFLYQLSDSRNVTLDVAGPGVLYFARFNHWHGSPWHFQVDGTDYVVQESSTADPTHPVENSIFLPARLFPNPLAWTWSATRGADLTWVPIPFERTFRMAYERTHYGTGHYIYHQYVDGAPLSQPLRAWNTDSVPAEDVLRLIARAGSDLLPPAGSVEAQQAGLEERSGEIRLAAGERVQFAEVKQAPAMLRALQLSAPRSSAIDFGRLRLRVTWDGRPDASIDSPLALFFGAGTLYNRDHLEYLVKAFPMHIRFDAERVYLACYFPMPFFRQARFELLNETQTSVDGVRWGLRYAPFRDPANHVAYFHASFGDHPSPVAGKDLILLDTRQAEGGGDWCGHFVGTSVVFSHRGDLQTLEGDPRFFFDDSQTPQAQGTGTEEWGGGGDYWGGRTMTLPFAGHPVGARGRQEAKCDEDLIESEYRFLLADLMPFGRNARIQLEHGGVNDSTEHYETVAYWYGLPGASLVKTDEFNVGDPTSEKIHAYVSPDSSAPITITSRYEWGVDHLGDQEVYPAHTEVGRTTTTTSEFTLKIAPENLGVMLRRTLDYSFPNQRAEVWVAPAEQDSAGGEADWKPAGIWYLAGSNACIFSFPKQELGRTEHKVETSNRRFRDDEFLLARRLTEGHSAIRIRVRFTPVNIPLFPGAAPQPQAWSEIRYAAYCFVLPAFEAPL